jgi:hypothetical protein
MKLSVRNKLGVTPDGEPEPFSSAGTGRVADGISRHSRLNGQLWFDTGVLAKGRHTVELRYLGTRNLLSDGRAIQLYKLEIVS